MIQLKIETKEKTSTDEVLEKAFPDISRSKLKKFYAQSRVMRNGFLCDKNSKLKVGEEISILKKPTYLDDILIYYEDKDIIVLEKPAYSLSVDSEKLPGVSIHSTLKKRYGAVFPVHRLDKETTGVMVFTLNRDAKNDLKGQFEQKQVERQYLAIAQNNIPEDKGTWDYPIVEGLDLKMRVGKSGKKAITNFIVLNRLKENLTYLKCILETGRKNQIRVHAAYCGFPLLGDSRYGDAKKGKRLFLHAHHLAFVHPKRKKKLSFISPIPKDFQKKVL